MEKTWQRKQRYGSVRLRFVVEVLMRLVRMSVAVCLSLFSPFSLFHTPEAGD